jgi:hypothetical protein
MAVVINEFEMVPAAAAPAEKGGAGAPPKRQPPDPHDVAALVRLAGERAARVRAH